MAITLVGQESNDTGATSVTSIVTAGSPVIAGTTLVVCTRGGASGTTVTSVTDTAGDTFVQAVGSRATTVGGAASTFTDIWYCLSSLGNGANAITVNFSVATQFCAVIVNNYTGVASFEVGANGSSNTVLVTTVASGSFSPAAAGNVNVAAGSQAVGGGTWSAGTGYGNLTTSGGVTSMANEDDNPAAAGAQTASIGYSLSSDMCISVASFKPSATVLAGSLTRMPVFFLGSKN